ncbi:hypothetical protein D3C73_1072560 [compost metagenome]
MLSTSNEFCAVASNVFSLLSSSFTTPAFIFNLYSPSFKSVVFIVISTVLVLSVTVPVGVPIINILSFPTKFPSLFKSSILPFKFISLIPAFPENLTVYTTFVPAFTTGGCGTSSITFGAPFSTIIPPSCAHC